MTAAGALVVGLGGVLLGAWLTGRHEQARRRAEFLEHQLRDLYSPLVSLLDQVLAKKRTREKVLQVAHQDPRAKQELRRGAFPRLSKHAYNLSRQPLACGGRNAELFFCPFRVCGNLEPMVEGDPTGRDGGHRWAQ